VSILTACRFWSISYLNHSRFDQSEYIIRPSTTSQIHKNQDIVFFGVLEILQLDWLSEQGLIYLERDFQEYDEKIHLSHSLSRLTLRALYGQRKGEGSHLKIRIKCNKHFLAHFLTCKCSHRVLPVDLHLNSNVSRFRPRKTTHLFPGNGYKKHCATNILS
jgi:hypothetical protein